MKMFLHEKQRMSPSKKKKGEKNHKAEEQEGFINSFSSFFFAWWGSLLFLVNMYFDISNLRKEIIDSTAGPTRSCTCA
jgi:hypothetical protein